MGLLRFLLAIAVVIEHSSNFFGLTLTGGVVAVQGFFMISGFYMAMILDRKYAKGIRGTFLFYSNRLLRIFPIYWVVLLLAVLVSVAGVIWPQYFHSLGVLEKIVSGWSDFHPVTSLFVVVNNLFILGIGTGFFLAIQHGVMEFSAHASSYTPRLFEFSFVPQAWSLELELELLVYCLAPFLFRRGIVILFGSMIAAFSLRYLAYINGLDSDPWNYRFLPFEFGLFLIGALVYRLYALLSVRDVGLVGWFFLVVMIGLTLVYPVLPKGAGFYKPFETAQTIYLLVLAISIPFVFIATRDCKIDRYIGELSYPIYLCHLIVVPMCSGDFGYYGFKPVVFSTALAAGLAYLVGRPLERFRQRRIEA